MNRSQGGGITGEEVDQEGCRALATQENRTRLARSFVPATLKGTSSDENFILWYVFTETNACAVIDVIIISKVYQNHVQHLKSRPVHTDHSRPVKSRQAGHFPAQDILDFILSSSHYAGNRNVLHTYVEPSISLAGRFRLSRR